MKVSQKVIDDLVFNFKNGNVNWADKRVTDIYRQGVMDVLEKIDEPKTIHKGWANIYKDYRSFFLDGRIYESEEEAREDENLDCYVATVEIKWES